MLWFLRRTIHLDNAAGGEPTGAGATPPANANGAPPAAPPATPPADPAEVKLSSAAFKERLAEEATKAQRRFLKDLGFDKAEDLQAVLKVKKELEEAQLSEQDKLKKRVKELEPLEQEAAEYKGIVKQLVDDQFGALPENVQKAIDEVANGSPRERLRLMRVMKAAGLGVAPAAGTAPPAQPAPKTTAPNGPAPPPNGGSKTKFEEWQELRGKNPMLAGLFYRNNAEAIDASRPADPSPSAR